MPRCITRLIQTTFVLATHVTAAKRDEVAMLVTDPFQANSVLLKNALAERIFRENFSFLDIPV